MTGHESAGRESPGDLARATREQLVAAGAPPDAVSLDASASEACCLVQDGNAWVTFYCERGRRTAERRFATEEQACAHLRALLSEELVSEDLNLALPPVDARAALRLVVSDLEQLAELLSEAGQPTWARTLTTLAQQGRRFDDLADPEQSDEAKDFTIRVVQLFGGMGSLNDLVLMDGSRVLPQQATLGALLHTLHSDASTARSALR